MNTIDQEIYRRKDIWEELLSHGGPKAIPPQLLRDLRIYGGAQGVWIDKTHTMSLTDTNTGITVGVLHTNSEYPDELSDDGIIYHYPVTNRPASRDQGEIDATKAACSMRVPIFIIARPKPSSNMRDVYLGYVLGWDDYSKQFLIEFTDVPPAKLLVEQNNEDAEFNITETSKRPKSYTKSRPKQQRFRFLVFQRYGPKCAVCDIDMPELLEAAHLVPKDADGTDDPRNGLVLCPLHHKALEIGLIGIHPESLNIVYKQSFSKMDLLNVLRTDIKHLQKQPHKQALLWLYKYNGFN